MKIVIDIPERDYDLACKYPNALIATYAHYIKDGTPYEERPQGEWIKHRGYNADGFGVEYSCSECNEWNGEKSRYCPNCGADMRGCGAK